MTISAEPLAFPSAEGAGRHTVGGRGGVVYEVTNLNDSGPGSLREAVEAYGPRTVVFRVSGTIKLASELKIGNAYITIAGQTAPGDGICLRDYPVKIDAHNVIIRYLRFRLGDETPDGGDYDAIWSRYRWNIILDHCSASWGVDETMSLYGTDSLTIQWCLISESLYMSHHEKGAHGYGGIWGGKNVSFHHNLFAHHSSRTPRFAGGETPTCVNVDFRNNVIYNWGFNNIYGGEGGTINIVANYYKPGPATKSNVRDRIFDPTGSEGRYYIADNYMDGFPDITANNWSGVDGSYAYAPEIKSDSAFLAVTLEWQPAEEAYELVLDNVGANYPGRDTVDRRVIRDVRTGTATCDGYYYEIKQGFSDTSIVRGIIDSQNDVGGWPTLQSLEAPLDSDHDGMPDLWEVSQLLDPNDPEDRNRLDEKGYTALENYLNNLVGEYVSGVATEPAIAAQFQVGQNYPNPFNPATTLQFFVPESGNMSIMVYDLAGQRVKNLYNGFCPGGYHSVRWQGDTDRGCAVSSGVYFAVFRFNGVQEVIKMLLMR